MFEDGQLTDGLGNTVDFKNTIIIMTSNLGARFLEKRGHLGFSAPADEGIPAKVEDMVRGEVKRAFNPEFLNRLDEVILFTSLTDDDLMKIIDLLVEQINVNLVAKQIKIRLTDEAARTSWRRPRIAATAPVRCAARCRSTSRIRCRKRSSRVRCPGPRSWKSTSAIPGSSAVRSTRMKTAKK